VLPGTWLLLLEFSSRRSVRPSRRLGRAYRSAAILRSIRARALARDSSEENTRDRARPEVDSQLVRVSPFPQVSVPLPPLRETVPFLMLAAVIACVITRESVVNKVSLLSPFFAVSVTYLIMFVAVPLADVHFDNPITHHELWAPASWLILVAYVMLYAGYRLVFALLPPRIRASGSRGPRQEANPWLGSCSSSPSARSSWNS
jgi:hypothetical protein